MSSLAMEFDFDISNDLVMVFEISRHGARNGKGMDPFQTQWDQGELTNVGRRQHYIMGQQIRQRYVNQAKILSPYYSPSQIYIKTTNDNETIESAYSQLMGLYPLGSNKYHLQPNTSQEATPQFNVSNDIQQKSMVDLQDKALPYDFMPFKILATQPLNDAFMMTKQCEFVRTEMENIKSSQEIFNNLDSKYSTTLYSLAESIFRDPSNFRSSEAVKFIDSLYARYYDKQEMYGQFTPELVHDMMVMYYDYMNQTITKNPTVLKALLTQTFNKIIQKFTKQIEKENGKKISKADQHKFFMYIDHDDVLMHFSNLYNHMLFHPEEVRYVPYASVILLELHRLSDGKYYVNASINGQPVAQPGPCNDQYFCEIHLFEDLARQYSYYDDSNGYEKVCGLTPESKYQIKMSAWNQSYQYAAGILRKKVNPYMRILELYAVLMLIIILAWIIYANLRGRDHHQNPFHPQEQNVEMT
ncbi:histidine acid phosphatase family protein [Stylonychia lemnae]|uniref:Histidine acid phosphatase family protein n=1 Tax=Stylonychia lemnae TaxID=5949 RepID=A0A078BD18_STYLE|nr:histidine acid phosphatase family protein [Stylonychia lemnae]|eukprot:CDW91112.1 histidine acid phosphatase family protein [Stylonychia lemnae]